mmetsp:Transcript_57200/g.113683  ORF Transcript_57200/g.113683 Transcript_57200/m.113683 type:complete len:97 (-) Transcript_57200:114-404(-)
MASGDNRRLLCDVLLPVRHRLCNRGLLVWRDLVPGNLAAWLMGLMRIHGLQMLRAPLASTVFKQEARLRQAEESQLPLLPLALLQEDPFSLFSPGQ